MRDDRQRALCKLIKEAVPQKACCAFGTAFCLLAKIEKLACRRNSSFGYNKWYQLSAYGEEDKSFMNDHYVKIREELLLTKQELVDRLKSIHPSSAIIPFSNTTKNDILYYEMLSELEDVNRALIKMEYGIYGICEETGHPIPIEDLMIMPTARTKDETHVTTMLQKTKNIPLEWIHLP